ncbi:Esterase TesA [Madurella mycetomatis]|uniref:Esterase TesA n=1 Tax=Madurella mycetomatis TaxID=100816 RepID=A0A175W0Q1_9PEZI|nr:Esterase TesA [Madurella mycetomatis]KXX77307.1 Esterase TesA [Madurella mycetomatis]
MKIANILAIAGLCATSLAQTQKVRIMYLGDSITEITCWRALVWDMLAAEGLTDKVEMVGSMNNNPQNCRATAPGFITRHEGHSGWQGVNIANQYLTGWLANSKPDIVQFMLGTNDVNGRRSTNDIIAAYTKMVEQMRASNPNMKIIVDKVIPLPFNNNPIEALNAAIPAWAAQHNTTESPIVIADCSSQAGYTAAMLRDGIHPNAQGDQLMARQIGPLLIQFIKDKLAGN